MTQTLLPEEDIPEFNNFPGPLLGHPQITGSPYPLDVIQINAKLLTMFSLSDGIIHKDAQAAKECVKREGKNDERAHRFNCFKKL